MIVLFDFKQFVLDNLAWLIAVVAALIIIIVFLIIFLMRRRPKKEEKPKLLVNQSEWLEALGGKDNIIEAYAVGSRLNLKMKDNSLVNKEKIKELGVENIIEMSGKIVLVVENNGEHILNELNKN